MCRGKEQKKKKTPPLKGQLNMKASSRQSADPRATVKNTVIPIKGKRKKKNESTERTRLSKNKKEKKKENKRNDKQGKQRKCQALFANFFRPNGLLLNLWPAKVPHKYHQIERLIRYCVSSHRFFSRMKKKEEKETKKGKEGKVKGKGKTKTKEKDVNEKPERRK